MKTVIRIIILISLLCYIFPEFKKILKHSTSQTLNNISESLKLEQEGL